MKKNTQNKAERYVIVTTAHKGVFAGILVGKDTARTIRLRDARMCIYWSREMHGLPGLAQMGPNDQCKISPSVPYFQVRDVTAVLDVTDIARNKWESAPWSQ